MDHLKASKPIIRKLVVLDVMAFLANVMRFTRTKTSIESSLAHFIYIYISRKLAYFRIVVYLKLLLNLIILRLFNDL